MKLISAYSDNRFFPLDFPRFSKAQKIGFTSKGFVPRIIQWKNQIPREKIKNLALSQKLKPIVKEYSELPVRFVLPKTHYTNNVIFLQLVVGCIRRNHVTPSYQHTHAILR